MLKLISWNVNGLRACHKNGFLDFVHASKPDILCLQEVRAQEEQIPKDVQSLKGYYQYWCPAELKKGYSGVGILSKKEPETIIKGMKRPEFDGEGRTLTAIYKNLTVVTAYFPNSQNEGRRIDYKVRFCKRMRRWVETLRKDLKRPVVVNGDFNIAHREIDLARPKENRDTSGFLPRERDWMEEFTSAGWIDTFRKLHPQEVRYSWWSARTKARERNIGWRIDYHLLSPQDASVLKEASIEDDVMGSDHCPVTVKIDV